MDEQVTIVYGFCQVFVEERSEEEMYSARGVDASLDCGYDFLSVHEMIMMIL